jgi:hypothetical protein
MTSQRPAKDRQKTGKDLSKIGEDYQKPDLSLARTYAETGGILFHQSL